MNLWSKNDWGKKRNADSSCSSDEGITGNNNRSWSKPDILFTHAQDTLMTVMSEINTARHLAKIMKKLKEIANGK